MLISTLVFAGRLGEVTQHREIISNILHGNLRWRGPNWQCPGVLWLVARRILWAEWSELCCECLCQHLPQWLNQSSLWMLDLEQKQISWCERYSRIWEVSNKADLMWDVHPVLSDTGIWSWEQNIRALQQNGHLCGQEVGGVRRKQNPRSWPWRWRCQVRSSSQLNCALFSCTFVYKDPVDSLPTRLPIVSPCFPALRKTSWTGETAFGQCYANNSALKQLARKWGKKVRHPEKCQWGACCPENLWSLMGDSSCVYVVSVWGSTTWLSTRRTKLHPREFLREKQQGWDHTEHRNREFWRPSTTAAILSCACHCEFMSWWFIFLILDLSTQRTHTYRRCLSTASCTRKAAIVPVCIWNSTSLDPSWGMFCQLICCCQLKLNECFGTWQWRWLQPGLDPWFILTSCGPGVRNGRQNCSSTGANPHRLYLFRQNLFLSFRISSKPYERNSNLSGESHS